MWKVPVDGSPIRGNPGAPVTLVMFSDFECPFCRKVAPTVDGLERKYGAQLRVVFKHNPLPSHARAPLAAEASIEAFRQKGEAGFWAMAQRLWEDPSENGPGRAALERHTAAIGLDVAKLRAALDSGARSVLRAGSDVRGVSRLCAGRRMAWRRTTRGGPIHRARHGARGSTAGDLLPTRGYPAAVQWANGFGGGRLASPRGRRDFRTGLILLAGPG
ncbi:thioredoxin domain-containing protein [Sorangium sp. So ce764]|uniref:DsbA family protein n=1 Tax=Sorangium sp. So ce764 TaxID=3133320 RepID=UPI003F5E8FD7